MSDTRPHVSASQTNMLFRCGQQYYHRYILGIKSPPGVQLVIGKGAHGAVERDLGNKMEWGELLPDDAVADFAADATRKAWEADGPKLEPGDPDEGGAVDVAVSLAQLHHRQIAPRIEPVAIERGFRLTVDGLSHDIVGYVDVEEADRIRDTKTASKSPPEDAADKSDQLTLYSLEAAVRGAPKSEVVLDYLVKTGRPQAITRKSTRTPEDHQRFLDKVDLALKTIAAGTFLPAPADSWNCSARWCGYYENHCPFGARGRVGARGLIDPSRLTSRVEARR